MGAPYVFLIAVVALVGGYIVGISYGRDDEGKSWRLALSTVESDSCRDAVRDALRAQAWE